MPTPERPFLQAFYGERLVFKSESDRSLGPHWHPGRTFELHPSCYHSDVVRLRQCHRVWGRLASILLVGACLLVSACDADVPCVGVEAPAFGAAVLDLQASDVSRENLRAWVELLTSPELRGRHAGESGADAAAALVAAQMAQIGLVSPDPARGLRSIFSRGGYCRDFPFVC